MASGPPPSEAGPSQNPPQSSSASTEINFIKKEPNQTPTPSYYSHLSNWPNPWPGNVPTYSSAHLSNQQLNPYSYLTWPQTQPSTSWRPPVSDAQKSPRSPSPPPDNSHRHWDAALCSFLAKMGLKQALRGLELDILVMNSEWERENAPKFVEELVTDLSRLKNDDVTEDEELLDARKLNYVHTSRPQPHSITIKEISKFLARNRSKNADSNKAEFLQPSTADGSGSARTNAKHQDRDLQMKYDIARNEDGPLRRTMQNHLDGTQAQGGETLKADIAPSEAQVHPGLDERLRNVETLLAIRYVPSIPKDFLNRLKFLEDHIVRLEKDYPPWAALHFNQPNRGWPPPPRSNPVIVPAHMRDPGSISKSDPTQPAPATNLRGEKSSLHQAVMQRLQVQQAMGELGTAPGNG